MQGLMLTKCLGKHRHVTVGIIERQQFHHIGDMLDFAVLAHIMRIQMRLGRINVSNGPHIGARAFDLIYVFVNHARFHHELHIFEDGDIFGRIT